ncbi:ABC transporter substrate-binding protein [Bosea sp. LjRoot237]|uniref:ABC transporter substrate-binding protein n=1 Tax=Bosea sp. LjRoot237 TaxID=3342292 RepID=UPI003ECEB623
MRLFRSLLFALTVMGLSSLQAGAETTVRAVMLGDLKITDPIWTTNYITRNHAYMIYDTLFALDEQGEIKPQMVDRFTASDDKLTYKFVLRGGLLWHDGRPVEAADCIASIKRWAAKDPVGQKLMSFIESIIEDDAASFTIKLKEPTGMLLTALAKTSPNVVFMMPKRIAETDPNVQISDLTGSGPFVFKRDEWKPGDKVVYVKFDKYKPRQEPPSGLAGGKVVKVDRVEVLAITDHQQAINALLAGEIDYMLTPPHDLMPLLKADKSVKLFDWNPLGNQSVFRVNWQNKPFDNEKVRRALWYAFNQKDLLDAVIGNREFYKECKALFPCDSPLTSNVGMDGLLESNFTKARELLKDAGYDGTPIVLLQVTDIAVLSNLSPVAKSLLEKAGFKVDVQAMDAQTMIARRTRKDGWHGFFTYWSAPDIQEPISQIFLAATCEKALYGWPCDARMEGLRDEFFRTTDKAKMRDLGEAIQKRNTEITAYLNVGQWYQPAAVRASLKGLVRAGAPVFWNIEKTR